MAETLPSFTVRTTCPPEDSPYYDDNQKLNNFSKNGGMFRKAHNNYSYECGNCTTYAYGRAWEIMDQVSGHSADNLGNEPSVTLSGDASEWYSNCDAIKPTKDELASLESETNSTTWYKLPTENNSAFINGEDIRGTPRQGAIGIISGGSYGHLFIVEKVVSVSELTGDMVLGISHSGYSSTPAYAFEFKYNANAYWNRESATITLGSPFAGSSTVIGFIYLPGIVGNSTASGDFTSTESNPVVIYSSLKEPKYYLPKFYINENWKTGVPYIYKNDQWQKIATVTSEVVSSS